MSIHAYPRSAVVSDIVRSGSGVVFAAVPLVVIETIPPVTVVLVTLLALFLFYGAQGLGRDLSRVEIDDRALRVSGWLRAEIAWRDLDTVRLRYFSTRRDRSGGWFQLTAGGGKSRLNVDSRLDAFDRVVKHAVAAARRNGAHLDSSTLSNLHALGLASSSRDVAEDIP